MSKRGRGESSLISAAVDIRHSVFFQYLHEELGAFGHERPENDGRGEAGHRAQHHEHSPALDVQFPQGKMCPSAWNHPPGQP